MGVGTSVTADETATERGVSPETFRSHCRKRFEVRLRLTWTALTSTCLLLMALGMNTVFASAASAQGMAYVRVVHAAPAAPTVDVYVDNSKLLSNFTFGTVTDYVPLAPGQHKIQVTPAGQPTSKAVISQNVTVNADTYYTVAAIGDPNTTPALTAFVDNNTISGNMAKARVYHLSSDAGPVSVATGGKTVISSLAFKNASDYLTVPAGSYTFAVTLLNSNKTVDQPVTLASGKVTSIFAVGLAGGSGSTALQFVAATVAGVPTSMPQTGFAPASHPTTTASPASLLLFGAGAALVIVLAGAGAFVVRRRVTV